MVKNWIAVSNKYQAAVCYQQLYGIVFNTVTKDAKYFCRRLRILQRIVQVSVKFHLIFVIRNLKDCLCLIYYKKYFKNFIQQHLSLHVFSFFSASLYNYLPVTCFAWWESIIFYSLYAIICSPFKCDFVIFISDVADPPYL